MSILSSAWVVVERPEQKFNLYAVAPEELKEILKIWGEQPSMLLAQRTGVFGEIVEQFMIALLYETEEEVNEAADYAYPRVVEILESMALVDKEIIAMENGEHDLWDELGLG